MAQESWLIEFMSAMVYSHGGKFVDDGGEAVMQDPKAGALAALGWLADAIQKHKVLSPGVVQSGELEVLKTASGGRVEFVLIPEHRLVALNDPKQSAVGAHFRQAMMPMGPWGAHATVGWMRFHGMTARAAATAERGEQTARLMEWFGGKADGDFWFQQTILKSWGSGFGIKSLHQDPEAWATLASFGDVDLMGGSKTSLAKRTPSPPDSAYGTTPMAQPGSKR